MKFAKRCLAMLLAFSMCAGMMFSTAYAEEAVGCDHDFGGWELENHPAGCEEPGQNIWQRTCSKCGKVEESTESLPATGHRFVDGECVECHKLAQPAGCTGEAGCTAEEHKGTCPENPINKPELPAEHVHEYGDPVHVWTASENKAATCTEDGVDVWRQTCAGCNDVVRDLKTLPALGHDYKNGTCIRCGEKATCTGREGCPVPGTGTHIGTCPRNPNNKPVAPAEHEHDYTVEKVITPRTCTEDGLKGYVCSKCGEPERLGGAVVGTKILATGHDYVDGVCSKCGAADPSVPEEKECTDTHHLGLGRVEGKDATCTEDGVKAHYECTACGKVFLGTNECTVDELVIPAAGHTEGEWNVQATGENVPATCTEDGVRTEYTRCTECGEMLTRTEAIPAVGHSYVHTDEVGNELGHALVCENCGETKSEGHSFSWTTVKKATCEEAGLEVYRCEDCGYVLVERVHSATGHEYVDGVCTECQKPDPAAPYIQETPEHMHGAGDEHKIGPVTVYGEVSCKQASYKVFYCFTCGGYFKETIPATEHVWSTGWTADVDGHHHVCEVCGRAQTTSAVPHAPSAAVRETEDGATYDVVRCADCGAEMSRTIVIDDPDIPMIDVPGGEPDDVYADDGEVELDDTAVPLAGIVTRAEFVGLLYDREGSPAAGMSTFEDVPYDHEYARAVGWAQANGIAFGVGGNRFAPDELVTAVQARLFLERYAQFKGVEVRELAALIGLDDDDILDNAGDVVGEFFGDDPPEFGEDAA